MGIPMSRSLLPSTLFATLMAGTAMADVPSVAVDIAPIHSLVVRVMTGVGEPDLVIPPGSSPHEHTLKPSEASALQNADLVFWMGADLAPWMEHAVETLAEGAAVTSLLDADGTILFNFREDALFEAHSHGDERPGHEEHAEEDHSDHDHQEHDEEEHDDHGHEGHDHGAHDPHAWLSPDNAATWMNVIAAKLSAADPDNAGTYLANAAVGRKEIEALKGEILAVLEPVRGHKFVAFHDAYQYFEVAFNFPALGAISLSDATDPGPARVSEIQVRVREEGVDCVLAEPQFNPAMVAAVTDGTEAAIGVLDPLGSRHEPGAGMYPQLMKDLANALATCLK